MIRSMEGRINFWNHGAEELYGWRKEEAQGKVSHDLLQTQFPKPLQEIESELVRIGRWEGKLVHTARDGHRVVVDSCWTFEFDVPSGTLVEINRPSANLETRTNNDDREIRQPALGSRSLDVNRQLTKVSSIVLLGGALICIAVASYGFTQTFNSLLGELFYGFIPSGVAGFLFASLRLNSNYKINLALVCMSLAFSVYGMELFLQSWSSSVPEPVLMLDLHRASDKEEQAAQLSKKLGVAIDPRNGAEVLADLNRKGMNAVPFLSPSNNLFVEQNGYRKSIINAGGEEIIPLAGISNRMTLLCNENGQWVSYKSDAHGFNNPDTNIWKSATVDIVALGDSFPQGYCVPPEKSFIALIRQRYPMTLNLGIAGDGPLMELATIREYLAEITPKIVLWFYCEDNDLVELQGERRTALLPLYLKGDFKQNLAARQTVIDDVMMKDITRQEAIARADELRRQQRHKPVDFADLLKLTMLRTKLKLPHVIQPAETAIMKDMDGPNLRTFEEVLAQAKLRVSQSNGKMYFVYLPSWVRYANVAIPEIERRERVLSIASSLRIPIIDIGQVFDRQRDPLSLFPFRQFGHYNETGHRLVAEELLKQLASDQAGQ